MSRQTEILTPANASTDFSKEGLSQEEVDFRVKNKQVNKTKIVVGKTYLEIFVSNVLTAFNILLFIIAGFLIWAEFYMSLFFMVPLLANIIIGLYQDIKARRLMTKLRIVSANNVKVIRGGQEIEIPSCDLVLDDLCVIGPADQICADAVVVEGECRVNESLLTGEARDVIKTVGSSLYSGTYVTGGNVLARVDRVGKDSYIETIQNAANKFKRSSSEILKALKVLFRVIEIIVLILGGSLVAIYAVGGSFSTLEDAKHTIGAISGSMVSMIPAGLYVLTSVALAVGVISLAKKKAHVQDFYSIEMLSRTNILCVDKTGTLTDGTMVVKKIITFGEFTEGNVDIIMSNLIRATKDRNATAVALKEKFHLKQTKTPTVRLPFTSENKYSGASFGDETYIIGAAEFMNLDNKAGVLNRAEEYLKKGYRVLALGKSNEPISGDKFTAKLTPIAIIVLQDHIKPDALETFEWFKKNGVEIKVISGDNSITVSEIAKQAGIPNAENYASLEDMSVEEVKAIASKYTVFGRVTPEQKEAIVMALKENKDNTVAMTGDGVNDILALKRADCSIAMASGSQAARNVSHIVLLDSNFSHLPDVVGEGRRVVNNIQRTSALYLVKVILAMVLTAAIIITTLITKDVVHYPFSTNNMYIWEILINGVGAFFLALQRNTDPIRKGFLRHVFKKAIPAVIMLLCGIGVIFLAAFLQIEGIMYTGVSSYGVSPVTSSGAAGMSTLLISALIVVILYQICTPLDRYRTIVICGCGAAVLGVLLMFFFLKDTSSGFKDLLRINFNSITGANYLLVAVVAVVVSAIYLLANYLTRLLSNKKQNKKEEEEGTHENK